MDRPKAVPSIEVAPQGIVSTELSKCVATLQAVGLGLDPWQAEIVRYILSSQANGDYAASRVVMSIPRQAGKTYLVGAVVLYDSLANPGTTTVWTAHRFKVARESFDFMRAVCTTPQMSKYVNKAQIHSAAGNEVINFRNGSRIIFAARERGAIRGFSAVRRIIFDEAQILSNNALADLLPTQNQARNPQRIMMGTPPKPSDESDAFMKARETSINGKTSRTYYVEYSAPPNSGVDDVDAWVAANPSLHDRTPIERMHDLREELPNEDDFFREAMGMWSAAGSAEVIDAETWRQAQAQDNEQPSQSLAVAVSVSGDLSSASVAFAGVRASDGVVHVELLEQRSGFAWVAGYIRKLLDSNKQIRAVVMDVGSSSRILSDDFTRAKIFPTHPQVLDIGMSTVAFVDGINNGTIIHIGQVQMEIARAGARKRPLGDTGLWAWSRKTSITDITPIEAATLAVWGCTNIRVKMPQKRSNGRRVVVYQ